MILLDTDIMVDLMRGHEPAIAWLDSLGAEAIGIPGLVAMELIQGCRDRMEQQQVERALRIYAVHWIRYIPTLGETDTNGPLLWQRHHRPA